MNQRLSDVLRGTEDNYLLPFYWQHGNHDADEHTERIPEQVERIYQSGARALCVESRPHNDFCGDGWWRDMDIILSECRKRDMKVWILDDRHFPTGYANGLLKEKYFHLRQWVLNERHIDVIGPLKGASILLNDTNDEKIFLGAYAYRRTADDEGMTGTPVCLTENCKNGYLYWDIPKGCWRIFVLYKQRQGGRAYYIDMISEESCRVQIEAVYEPHYEHYAEYFGNTIAGFFSDEPSFGNGVIGRTRVDRGMYEHRIGMEGQTLPYNEKLLAMMSEELGEDALPYLGELWYVNEHSHLTRLAYMNAATRLYRDCFCYQLGDWCRDHGVEYIGHVIEDMNAHARLGCSGGHFFRALDGQDMGGIDIVLHQVMPGFGHYMHTASCSGGMVDPEFFHYVLAKLAASHGHQNPRMKGRSMCEVFGAYGWGEGTPMMKWLMDFLLVRGVNHFVPHAFSPDYPDPDCPPHFGAEGHDPQFDGFSALMKYTNQVSHLLCGADHIAPAAILYHAEGEWMSAGDSMLTQKPAKVLYDAQIDFDIVCGDVLENAAVENGQLVVNRERHNVLIVPYAHHLPKYLCEKLSALSEAGLPVWFVDGLPEEASAGKIVALEDLAAMVRGNRLADLSLEKNHPLLSVYHCRREDCDVIMLFNESPDTGVYDTLRINGLSGKFNRLRLLEGGMWLDETVDGATEIHLAPGQSEILVFGAVNWNLPVRPQWDIGQVIAPEWTVEIADSDDLESYKPYCTTDELFNLNAPEHLPHFSGKIRYTGSLNLDRETVKNGVMLDLGQVGQNARLSVNGVDCGIRICAPYCFDLSGILKDGENTLEIVVSNTLAQKHRDNFSFFLALEPDGLLGDIRLLKRI